MLRAEYSYDGVDFDPVGRSADISGWSAPQIGPAALSDAASTFPVARFDWIRFNPDSSTGGGGGGGSSETELFADQFDGTDLGAGWEVVRRDQALTVSGSALRIPAATGDLYAAGGNATNLALRALPASGPWTATAKVNFEAVAQYQQAGIMVYGGDDDYLKLGRIAHTAAGDEKFEYIHEAAGTPDNTTADSTANIAAAFPDDYWVQLRYDGTNVTGWYSPDGSVWTQAGRAWPLPANARVGVFAFGNQAATAGPEAAFDSFRITQPGAASGPSFDDEFDGSTLDAERWNASVRQNANAVVGGGQLTITTEPGDIYTGDTTPPPNNFILQDASHAGSDWVIETKLSGTINGGYAQGGLIAYVDGGDYVKVDAISDAGNTRINRLELRSEVGDAVQDPQPNVDVPAGTTNIWLRLSKTGSTYAGEYSFDGATFTAFPQSVTNAMQSPDFGVFAFGPQAEGQGDTVSFDYFWLNGKDTGGECECQPTGGDAFDSATLDKQKWNAIVREQADLYALNDGWLEITTVNGDIYTNGDPAPTRNFILQEPTAAGQDWVIETHIDAATISGGYEQAGLLVRADDDNYIKFDIISDDGQTVRNRLELRSEINGAIQAPQPADPAVPNNAAEVWLRLTKSGTSYTGEYSFDGTTWSEVNIPVTNPMVDPAFGLFTLGVNSGGGRPRFDYFSVDGSTGCEEPEPENAPPVIGDVTASPTIGTGPLQVDFTAAATDADGDDLTYSWDFQDDGTEDSTEQNPTFTYTTPGTKTAVVTVSDGTASRTKSVTVQVLEPDQAGARFRVLVFSKTAGFRHSSIDEGHAAIEQLGADNNFQVDHTEDATAFRDAILANYEAVVWLSTTGDVLNATQQGAFERYIRAGGGYAGIHAAADTEYDWKWYGRLVGAYFLSHPSGVSPQGGRDATVVVEDTTDRSTQGLPAPQWNRNDEWYNYKPVNFEETGNVDYSPRANVHVLASLDESTYEEADGSDGVNDDHPISWCRKYDGGRSWYTGMGHTEDSYAEANFLKHILGGIEDAAGAAGPDICNLSPTVAATADPKTGTAPLLVAFSANGADPEGQAMTYAWDFGDGGTSLRQNPDHTYTEPGTYTAKVTVKDSKGATGTATVQIVVASPPANVPPTVEAAGDPTAGKPPLAVQFSAAGSDANGDTLTYSWNFGDGGTSFVQNPSHTYATAGTYTATVTVSDGRGGTATDSVQVVVGNRAPTVVLATNTTSGKAPLNVTFTATGSDPDGDALTYRYNFGDGSKPATGATVSHKYTKAGTYTATVTVTDTGGSSSTASVQITATKK
jgi:PKD repeat protein